MTLHVENPIDFIGWGITTGGFVALVFACIGLCIAFQPQPLAEQPMDSKDLHLHDTYTVVSTGRSAIPGFAIMALLGLGLMIGGFTQTSAYFKWFVAPEMIAGFEGED